MWYNGYFSEKMGRSRFGVNSFNSRTSTWHSGYWLGGEFHSRLNLNDDGQPDVSDVHKYSIWYTGNWFVGILYYPCSVVIPLLIYIFIGDNSTN